MRRARRGTAGVRPGCCQLPRSHAVGHDLRGGRPPRPAPVPPNPAHEGALRRTGAPSPLAVVFKEGHCCPENKLNGSRQVALPCQIEAFRGLSRTTVLHRIPCTPSHGYAQRCKRWVNAAHRMQCTPAGIVILHTFKSFTSSFLHPSFLQVHQGQDIGPAGGRASSRRGGVLHRLRSSTRRRTRCRWRRRRMCWRMHTSRACWLRITMPALSLPQHGRPLTLSAALRCDSLPWNTCSAPVRAAVQQSSAKWDVPRTVTFCQW